MLKEVVYCGVCTYPPEYCEFSGKLKRCKIWLQENHAELFEKLYSGEDAEVEGVSGKLAESSIGEKREEKLEKDLLKMQAKQENREQRELAKKLSSKIIIRREARTKRKSIVAISGLEVFEIDMKKLAKTFASKFATGCSVSKNAEKKDEIVIQGDVMEEVENYLHSILAEKGLKDVKVEVVDGAVKKKKKPEGA
ncbi:translation machinery-associated protein 22 [Zygosaccharomyces mellis]|uniref:Translation machinery-associated protein 22 n=1 Tax=Zygosaccharomyces mellis TaxID=42258 RepID=A0A4C2E3A8_9SACH|nr:translation machinery-associated protein 22 [Zygosaccharomyces mellis]